MQQSPLVAALIDALRCLPGVGAKSAQRMAFHLLERDRPGGKNLAEKMHAAMEQVGNCRDCRNFTEQVLCEICANQKRDHSLLCVVESPTDVAAIEQVTGYSGLYFVLMGRLSPLDGIGPMELGLDRLERRLRSASVQEVILATNTTVEGEATSHYIAELAKSCGVKVMRIAQGVPVGGELEYLNSGTLAHAFAARRLIE